MALSVLILGSAAAAPTLNRNQTSQLVTTEKNIFLVDCGEATQIQLRRYKVRFQQIDHIFISHLHGDHFFGLIGFSQLSLIIKRLIKQKVYLSSPMLKNFLLVQRTRRLIG